MKEKLIASLKTKYKHLGFGDKAFDGVAEFLSKTVTEESQIETAIAGVEPILKSIQGDIDRVRTEKTELQRKYEELEKKVPKTDPPKNDPPAADPNEPAWFKAYREKQDAEAAALKLKIEGFEKKETQSGYLSKLKATLKEKGVPEVYYAKRNLAIESDEQLTAIATEIETDYTGFRQEMVNQGVMIDIPKSTDGASKEGATLGKSLAEKRNANASDGVKGKEI
ncbi:MAG TPA: hypothetical protein DHV48_03685 [Prolixibacteraceae bacterium]|nr:hypothetical protein [Prolixibacteraceae bacterium]